MNKIKNYFCIISFVFLYSTIILCLFLDGVVGSEKVTNYVRSSKTIDLGYLAEKQFVINRTRINNMFAEIQRLRQEDSKLLKSVLKSNNIFLEKGQLCDFDLATRKFKFYDAASK